MDNRKKSYISFISSMLIFGTIGIFRRYIPLSSSLIAAARGLTGAVFLFALIKIRDKKVFDGIDRKKILLLVLSGLAIGLNWVFLFEAYNYTTVATATLCYYMQPVIVILVSPVLFKEKLTLKKIICAVTAVFGMALVSGVMSEGGVAQKDVKGIIFGLCAAVLYSAVVIINKVIGEVEPFSKTAVQLFSAGITLIPYVLFTENFSAISVSPLAIVLLVIVGLFHTGIAYSMYFGSMQGLETQTVAILSYIDPVSALILSAIILKEAMTVYSVIGAVLILGAAAVSEINTDRLFRRKNKS